MGTPLILNFLNSLIFTFFFHSSRISASGSLWRSPVNVTDSKYLDSLSPNYLSCPPISDTNFQGHAHALRNGNTIILPNCPFQISILQPAPPISRANNLHFLSSPISKWMPLSRITLENMLSFSTRITKRCAHPEFYLSMSHYLLNFRLSRYKFILC